MLERRAKMGRFWPSFALACLNGGSTASIARDSTVTAAVTGDGGDDDLRLTMMDNDLVTIETFPKI